MESADAHASGPEDTRGFEPFCPGTNCKQNFDRNDSDQHNSGFAVTREA